MERLWTGRLYGSRRKGQSNEYYISAVVDEYDLRGCMAVEGKVCVCQSIEYYTSAVVDDLELRSLGLPYPPLELLLTL